MQYKNDDDAKVPKQCVEIAAMISCRTSEQAHKDHATITVVRYETYVYEQERDISLFREGYMIQKGWVLFKDKEPLI